VIGAAALVAAVDGLLGEGAAEVVQDGERDVLRLGLALDGSPSVAGRAQAEGLDALLLHRAKELEPPPGLLVLACHDAFDARLGLAGNGWLHDALGLADVRPLTSRAVVATAPPDLRERVRATFGGEEALHAGAGTPIERAVLGDAMTDQLVRDAVAAGAGLYVTGAWRVPAGLAVAETGLAVQVVGHRRQERWALRLLARLLADRLPGVRVRALG
jgi:putative NIF3 family GTP cyclohydrolase 1 type 2